MRIKLISKTEAGYGAWSDQSVSVCVNLWLSSRLIFRPLIVYGFQRALKYRAVCRVGGAAELRHDARARDSHRFKLSAAGALVRSGCAPDCASIRYRLLPLEYFFHLPGQSIAVPSHSFHLTELIDV